MRLRTPPPTPEQAEAIVAPLRPYAIVAGAGSGKTQTMGLRVAWLVAVATERHLGGERPGMNEDRAASGREVASRSGDRRLVAPEWPPAFGRLAG